MSRAQFYAKYIGRVRTLRLGRRNIVDLELLDELVDELLGAE